MTLPTFPELPFEQSLNILWEVNDRLPELGELKIYMPRPLQGDPKEVTLVKKASNWYAHISCDIGDTPKVEPTEAIAVDMGTTHYLTTSEGEKEDNPRWYRKAEGLLRKHSKDLSRKKLGSNRRKKQQHKIALHHERTVNRRKDFIGKLVYKLLIGGEKWRISSKILCPKLFRNTLCCLRIKLNPKAL